VLLIAGSIALHLVSTRLRPAGTPPTPVSLTGTPEASPSVILAGRSEFQVGPSPSAGALPALGHTQPSGAGTVVSSGSCVASYYGVGKGTASGEPFDPTGFTAAHRTLPFNTRVRVTNAANGRSVLVRVNDRGPYVAGRCLDLSTAAFRTIASEAGGVATVRYDVLA
jgi:rare lipoprotein A